MSVTLHVRLSDSLPLSELELASTGALREILNINCDPVVRTAFDRPDLADGEPAQLSAPGKSVPCWIQGYEDKVVVMPFQVPQQVPSSNEVYSFVDQPYVSIGPYAGTTSLCWALTAAVALGVARREHSNIEDNSGFFTASDTQTTDDFRDKVKLEKPYTDLPVARRHYTRTCRSPAP